MEIRKIKEEEVEDFARVGRYAFGNWSDEVDPDDWKRIDLNECIGIFVDGRMAARLRNVTFEQVIRGVQKPMGGIASVASYPEHRRQGYIRQLMQAAFADMQQKGQVISALYPFREGFYGRFGYTTTNNHLHIKIPTHSLEHHLAAAADLDGGWTFTRQRAKDSGQTFVPFLYEMILQFHGFVSYLPDDSKERPASSWKDKHVILVEQNGRIQAGARYQVKGALSDGVLSVEEMVWRTKGARDKLFGYFARHADATPSCWLNIPPGVNFQSWLHEPMVPFEAKFGTINMMGRIVDVIGALQELPAATEGELCFAYEDEQCPWNNGRYRLTAQNGKLQTEKTDTGPQLNLSVQGLSALVYGSISIEEIIHRGWATNVAEPTQQLLAHWFPPLFTFNLNYF